MLYNSLQRCLKGEPEMNKRIKIVQCGLGHIGTQIARMILTEKKNFEIVGVIDTDKRMEGKDLSEIIRIEEKSGIEVSNDPKAIFSAVDADIAIYATVSSIEQLYRQVGEAMKAGTNIISTCPELIYPYYRHADVANRIDRDARKYGVTILGTGVNPGFVLDTLIIVLSAVCTSINRIKATRVVDYSDSGPTSMSKHGIGRKLTEQEYRSLVANGDIQVHEWLQDSMSMVAGALGWQLNDVQQTFSPIVSLKERRLPCGITIEPGTLSGYHQTVEGIYGNQPVMTFNYVCDVFPEMDGLKPHDVIVMTGIPSLSFVVEGGIPGAVATTAMTVNMIPQVMNATPGLKTMTDLPLPRALIGNMTGLEN